MMQKSSDGPSFLFGSRMMQSSDLVLVYHLERCDVTLTSNVPDSLPTLCTWLLYCDCIATATNLGD